MQHLKIPETPILQGEDAVKALNEYILELKMEDNLMDEKQRIVMLKLAEGLISTVRAEVEAQKTSVEPISTRVKNEKKGRFLQFFTHAEEVRYRITSRVREQFPLL